MSGKVKSSIPPPTGQQHCFIMQVSKHVWLRHWALKQQRRIWTVSFLSPRFLMTVLKVMLETSEVGLPGTGLMHEIEHRSQGRQTNRKAVSPQYEWALVRWEAKAMDKRCYLSGVGLSFSASQCAGYVVIYAVNKTKRSRGRPSAAKPTQVACSHELLERLNICTIFLEDSFALLLRILNAHTLWPRYSTNRFTELLFVMEK